MVPASKRAKTVHALDRSATVTGPVRSALFQCYCCSRSLLAGGSEGDRLRGPVERGANKPSEAGSEVGAVGGLEHPPELPPRVQGTAGSRAAGSDTPGLRLSSNSNFELCTSHPELEQG
jgi:hypothetical protein